MLVLALAGGGAFVLPDPDLAGDRQPADDRGHPLSPDDPAYPTAAAPSSSPTTTSASEPAPVAASALLTDYTLTVAVSVAAGVAAITSAVPGLLPLAGPDGHRIRGSWSPSPICAEPRSRPTLFALPTYAFVVTVFTMLVIGFIECADGECPQGDLVGTASSSRVARSPCFLILRAFASGSTALTGVEAVANGVQAFRHAEGQERGRHPGRSWVSSRSRCSSGSRPWRGCFEVRISEETVDTYGTVISQIGRAAFNGGVGFWMLQVFTAGILFLAANTAYQDFPRLSAILARHKTDATPVPQPRRPTGVLQRGHRPRHHRLAVDLGLRRRGVTGSSSCTWSACS